MEWNRIGGIIGLVLIATCLAGGPESQAAHGSGRRHRSITQVERNAILRAFQIGVCVGEALQQQDMTLPMVPPGQTPVLDSPTQAAFETAVQDCQAQYSGVARPTGPGGAYPSPSASPGPVIPTG